MPARFPAGATAHCIVLLLLLVTAASAAGEYPFTHPMVEAKWMHASFHERLITTHSSVAREHHQQDGSPRAPVYEQLQQPPPLLPPCSVLSLPHDEQ